MKYILILLFSILSIYIGFGQNYDVRFNRTSINCATRQVCYDVQIRKNGASNFNLAGQNYRIFYNSALASYVSGTSLLPSSYSAYTLVQNLQHVDGSSYSGALSFQNDLGFLNYAMDLNDTDNGGIVLPSDGSWFTTSNICFNVTQQVIDNPNVCIELVWARENLTAEYATAFVQVSRWVSSGVTTNSTCILHDDLNSIDGDQACFNIACSNLTIGVADITVNENVGNAQVQVCLSGPSTSATTVILNTSNGTATAGLDYTALTNVQVNIPAGQTCAIVNLPIIDDQISEPSETINIAITNPSSNVTIGDGTGVVTITDNDGAPTLSINDITVNENAGTATLTISLSSLSSQPVSVTVNTLSGTATSGSDFTGIVGSTVIIPAGQNTGNVVVNILDDITGEPTETFNVQLSSPINATIADGTGLVTILDNDNTLSITDITVNENVGNAQVQVCLNAPSTSATTATINTSNGTASAGLDYTSLTNVAVSIPAGQTCAIVNLPIIDDQISEPSETINVTITNPSSNVTIGDGTGVVTITDNDGAPTLSINDITVNENAGTATLTISLSSLSSQPVSVTVNTLSGTAISGSDFTGIVGSTVTIPAGQNTATLVVNILDDSTGEPTETFNVQLSGPINATIADGTGVVTILDNDNTLSITDITVNENVGNAQVQVCLSAPSTSATTATINTSNGTANAGLDYTSLTNVTVSIPAGQTCAIVNLPIIDDQISEPSETINVTITNPSSNVTIGDGTGVVTITDNDGAPTLSINDITVNENAGTATLTISLSSLSSQPVSVTVNTLSGTAISGADFTGIVGSTVTIPAGQNTGTVVVSILDDSSGELTETFNVQLSSPINATIVDGVGVVTILDDDSCNAKAPILSRK